MLHLVNKSENHVKVCTKLQIIRKIGRVASSSDVSNLTFFFGQQPPVGQGLLIHEFSRSYTTTHHSRQDSSGRSISSSQRPPADNTQHSQQTNIHAPLGIRTHILSRWEAADLRLKPRDPWDRQFDNVLHQIYCLRLSSTDISQRDPTVFACKTNTWYRVQCFIVYLTLKTQVKVKLSQCELWRESG